MNVINFAQVTHNANDSTPLLGKMKISMLKPQADDVLLTGTTQNVILEVTITS